MKGKNSERKRRKETFTPKHCEINIGNWNCSYKVGFSEKDLSVKKNKNSKEKI